MGLGAETMRIFKAHARRKQAGDTIVEVLIAVGIVSMVLVSAYAVTNRNVRASQETQEQMYAQKLAEQQAELLRSTSISSGGGCFNSTNVFVISAPHSAACERSNEGAKYGVSITNSGSRYKVNIDWVTLGGGTSNVTIYYWTAG